MEQFTRLLNPVTPHPNTPTQFRQGREKAPRAAWTGPGGCAALSQHGQVVLHAGGGHDRELDTSRVCSDCGRDGHQGIPERPRHTMHGESHAVIARLCAKTVHIHGKPNTHENSLVNEGEQRHDAVIHAELRSQPKYSDLLLSLRLCTRIVELRFSHDSAHRLTINQDAKGDVGGKAAEAPMRPSSAADVSAVVCAHKAARIEKDNARLRELIAAIESKNADGELELQLMRQAVSTLGGGGVTKPSELDKAVASCESQATIEVLSTASYSIPAGAL